MLAKKVVAMSEAGCCERFGCCKMAERCCIACCLAGGANRLHGCSARLPACTALYTSPSIARLLSSCSFSLFFVHSALLLKKQGVTELTQAKQTID